MNNNSKFISPQTSDSNSLNVCGRKERKKEQTQEPNIEANTIYTNYDIKSMSSPAPNKSYRKRTDILEQRSILCLNLIRCWRTNDEMLKMPVKRETSSTDESENNALSTRLFWSDMVGRAPKHLSIRNLAWVPSLADIMTKAKTSCRLTQFRPKKRRNNFVFVAVYNAKKQRRAVAELLRSFTGGHVTVMRWTAKCSAAVRNNLENRERQLLPFRHLYLPLCGRYDNAKETEKVLSISVPWY